MILRFFPHAQLVLLIIAFLFRFDSMAHAQTANENVLLNILTQSTPQNIKLHVENVNPPDPQSPLGSITRVVQVASADKPEISILGFEVIVYKNNQSMGQFNQEKFTEYFGKACPSIIEYSYLGLFRNYALGSLKCSTRFKAYDQSEPLDVFLLSLDAELNFKNTLPLAARPADPFFTRVMKPLCSNARMDWAVESALDTDSARRATDANKWLKFLMQSQQSGPVARLEVNVDGPVVASQDALTSAGLDAASFDSTTMRLFCDGKAIPFLILKQTYPWKIAFYSKPFATHDIYRRTYYLVSHPIDETLMGPAIEQPYKEQLHVLTRGTGHLLLQPRQEYMHQIKIQPPFSHWYWMDVPRNEFRTIELDLPDFDRAGFPPQLRLLMPNADPNDQTQCAIYLNGNKITTARWNAPEHKIIETSATLALWNAGKNSLVVEFPISGLKSPAESLYLTSCEIVYPQLLQAQKGILRTEVESPSSVNLECSGLAQDAFAVDCTNNEKPVFLQLASREGQLIGTLSSAGKHQVIFCDPMKAPQAHISSVAPINSIVQKCSASQMLIIGMPEGETAINPLLAYHRTRGVEASFVSVESIFEQFSYGQRSPLAIRDFLRNLYYQNLSGKQSLESVILLGESSDLEGAPAEWPKDAMPDQVPVFVEHKPIPEPRGDFLYGLMNSADSLPDISVTRIPAANSNQISAVVQKILRYANSAQQGEWRSRNLFITDDETIFGSVAEQIESEAVSSQLQAVKLKQEDYPYVHLYEGRDLKWSPDAASALLKKIDNGALTTLYLGHGGPNIWSHERLFHLEEMHKLQNLQKPTFVAVGSCDSAWLDYPLEPAKSSIGEQFVLYPNGGAIGVFAPTSGGTPNDHLLLLEPLYSAIFKEGIKNIGDAVLSAEISYSASNPTGNLPQQYVLLGDPLTEIVPPSLKMDVFVTPTQTIARTKSKATVTAYWPGAGMAKAQISLRVAGKENQILAENVPFINGRLRYECDLDSSIPEGRHVISIYAQNPKLHTEAVGQADLEFVREAFQLIVDPDILQLKIRQPGEKVKVSFSIENRCPADLRDVTLMIKPLLAGQQPLTQKISLKSRERLARDITVQMASGVQGLQLFVFGPGGNPQSTASWERATIVFPVAREWSGGGGLESLGDLIEISPWSMPPDTNLSFAVPVWNLTQAKTPPLRAKLLDEAGQELGTPADLPDGLAPGGKHEFSFACLGLKPGRHQITALFYNAEGNDLLQTPLLRITREIQIEPHADLIFVPGSIKFKSKEFIDGQTVFISAEVKNQGGRESQPCIVDGYKGAERIAKNKVKTSFGDEKQTIPALKPGEVAPVILRWDDLHAAGIQTIRLWVNGDKAIPENNYENNWIEENVTIKTMPNIYVAKAGLIAMPAIARPGQKVKLTSEIDCDREQDLSEMRVAILSGNNRDYLKINGDPLQPAMSAATKIPVQTEAQVDAEHHFFAVEANYKRLIAETIIDDNRAETAVDLLVKLRDLRKDDQSYDLLSHATSGRMEGVRLAPDGTMTCRDFADFTASSFDVTSGTLHGAFLNKNNEKMYADNLWAIRDRVLEAAPEENASSVTLSVPHPSPIARAYDVYLRTRTIANYRDRKAATKLCVRLPGERMQEYDFTNDVLPWNSIRYSIGRAPRVANSFDLIFSHPASNAWAAVEGVDLVPLVGTYLSPCIDVDDMKGQPFYLGANVDTPDGSAINFSARFGRLDGKGGVQWQDWHNVNIKDSIIPNDSIMQVRAELIASITASPSIRSLFLHQRDKR